MQGEFVEIIHITRENATNNLTGLSTATLNTQNVTDPSVVLWLRLTYISLVR
jgi:hypothetical protein